MKQKLLKSFLLLCSFIVGSVAWADDYQLYSGDLTPGEYIIYYSGRAMNTTVSSNRLQYTAITPTNNVITTTDASIVWRITANETYWTIYNAAEKKYAASTGTKNQAGLSDDRTSDNVMWTVSGTETYEFVNKANSASKINANLRNNGTYGFACYSTSTGGPLSLYKKVETPADQVATPIITGETPFLNSTEVTITCATEGATIQYCVAGDGINFTDYSTYTEPFQLSYGATVKAKATKSGLTASDETTKVFTKVTPTPNVRNIEAVGTSDQYVVLDNALVTYKNGKYAYLEDWAGAMLLYNCAGDLEAGDMLNGYMHVTGYQVYSDLPEVTAFELVDCTITHGNTVTPKVMTLEQLTDNNTANPFSLYYSQYVKIVDATVTKEFTNNGCTISQGDNPSYSIVVYDQNKSGMTVTLGDVVTVTGHVSINNGTKEIVVFEQSQIVVKDAPVIPTIAEVRAAATSSEVTTQGIVTSCSVGPKYATAFIQDATAAICVYAPVALADDLAVGNKINVTGTLKLWSNLLRIDDPTITVVSTGNTVTPEVTTIPEIYEDWETHTIATVKQGMLVKIESATVLARYEFDNTTNAGIQQGEKSLMVIGIPKDVEYAVGDIMTLIGNISNNGTLCIDNPTNIVIKAEEVDYAFLPFVWEGGDSSTLKAMLGVKTSGLGSDYAESNAPYRVKLDGTGDYIQVKTDSQPGAVVINVKMIGGPNTSKITVQESADGENFTDLEDLEISGSQYHVVVLTTTKAFAETTRYVRFLFTKGSNVGVGYISIGKQETVTINEAGYATCVTKHMVSFPEGLNAYIVTAIGAEKVQLKKVTAVPAETPVVVEGAAGTYTLIPSTSTDAVRDNLLKASDGTVTGKNIYILAKPEGKEAGFYALAEGTFVAEGKAYIQIASETKAFYFSFEDEDADGINSLTPALSEGEGAIFNLAGQRISKMQKGINIVNGKKVLR